MNGHRRSNGPPAHSRRAAARDAGLAKVTSATKWLAAAALAASGLATVAVANAFPGRSAAAGTSDHPSTTLAPAVPTPPTGSQDTAAPASAPQATAPAPSPQTVAPQTLAPAPQAPQYTYSPPVASSGGS